MSKADLELWYAVQWDGFSVKSNINSGPNLLWLTEALRRDPETPNAVMRMGQTVHVWNAEKELTVLMPGDWLLCRPEPLDLKVQLSEEIVHLWQPTTAYGYVRREFLHAGAQLKVDNAKRIRNGWHTVTAASNPRLHAAFNIVSHDEGGGASHEVIAVPPKYPLVVLDQMEESLKTLTDDELETFCIGEHSDMRTIAERSIELTATHALLGEFFENWEGVS
jgi:hypothetical protein